jgi:prolipoprotein diacylglyceryltransferase
VQDIAFEIFNISVYKYGVFVSLGALFALITALFSEKRKKLKYGSSILTFVIAVPLSLLLSRLLFCFTDAAFKPFLTFKNIFNFRLGGMSMFGAILGVILAAFIASKILNANDKAQLDAAAPSIMAFVFFERIGEKHSGIGISRPLVTGVLDNSFLSLRGDYDIYLKTWLLEAAAAAVLLAVLFNMLKKDKDGYVFLSWLLLFGGSQAVFESLRFDYHMRFAFVGVQQLLAAAFFGTGIIKFACKIKPLNAKAKIALTLFPISVLAILGLEFLIDRSSISKWLLYAVYIAIIAVNWALALNLKKETNINGES